MGDQKITTRYIFTAILAVIFTWVTHEFVHWLTGELLGYKSIMRLNGVSTIGAEKPDASEAAIISISAPIFTILQGLFVFILLRSKGWNKYAYTLLFTAFYMRFLAGFLNLIMLNDEGRVSQYLGLGTFTVSIIVSALLFYMVYKVSVAYQVKWKFQLWTFVIILLASWTLIFADQFFVIRLI